MLTAALAAMSTALAHEGPASRLPSQLRYMDDPVGWVEAFVRFPRGGLSGYQREIMSEVLSRKRVAVRGPHGLGKTTLLALLVLWFATTRDGLDWKVVTTASAWRQLTKFLWPEIHKWARLVDWDALGIPPPRKGRELMDLSLKLRTGEAFAIASDQPAAIEGAHADHLMYIFDEAKTIPGDTFDAAEGAFSAAGSDTPQEALVVAVSTPGVGQSRFREIHERGPGYEDWWVRRVTLKEAIDAGRISAEWAAQRMRQWGEGSAVYITRVLGEFAEQDESGIIPIEWIYRAVERWRALNDTNELADMATTFIGADVGDGGDPSILARWSGRVLVALEEVAQRAAGETMQVAGRLKGIVDAHACGIALDTIGVGAGVGSRLRELRVRYVAFVASAASSRKDRSGEIKFLNLRAEGWWSMREALDPEFGDDLALPDDPQLIGELAAPRYEHTSSGRLKVESKDDVKARLGRSTDKADAAIMGRWGQGRVSVGGPRMRPAWGSGREGG